MRKPITDKIIDILMFFVKKKKSIPNKGASNHHPDLLTSCNLLTLTLIPGRNVKKKTRPGAPKEAQASP